MGQWIFKKFWCSCCTCMQHCLCLKSSVQNSLGIHTMWYENCCISKRLKLGSDMVLEEAVTAARHNKSILLDILGMDILVDIYMLNVWPKEVTSCRCSRKSQHVCTCYLGDIHILSADLKSDSLLPEMFWWQKLRLIMVRSHLIL